MRRIVKRKLARLAAQERAIGAERPAGQRLRERRDVLLRIAAVDAERVQLENLAREVLVDAELAIARCRAPAAALRELRARADRSLVVQVQDHCRMRLDRGEHVDKASGHVRPDRFVLQRTGERQDLRLVGGNGEVVGPEMHEPLAERLLRCDGNAVAGGDLVEIVRRELGAHGAEQALRCGRVRLGLLAIAAQLGGALEDLRGRRQASDLVRHGS